MSGELLTLVGSATVIVWGVAHLTATGGVVESFGEISADNRRILAMEWITEGAALIFAGLVVAGAAWVGPEGAVSLVVSWITAGFLISLAVVSLFTGFKVSFLPFRLCPFIFTASAVLILLGAYI